MSAKTFSDVKPKAPDFITPYSIVNLMDVTIKRLKFEEFTEQPAKLKGTLTLEVQLRTRLPSLIGSITNSLYAGYEQIAIFSKVTKSFRGTGAIEVDFPWEVSGDFAGPIWAKYYLDVHCVGTLSEFLFSKSFDMTATVSPERATGTPPLKVPAPPL